MTCCILFPNENEKMYSNLYLRFSVFHLGFLLSPSRFYIFLSQHIKLTFLILSHRITLEPTFCSHYINLTFLQKSQCIALIAPRLYMFLNDYINLTLLQSSQRVGLAQDFTRFCSKQTLRFGSCHSTFDWPEISHVFTTQNKPYVFAVVTERWICPRFHTFLLPQTHLSLRFGSCDSALDWSEISHVLLPQTNLSLHFCSHHSTLD